MKIVYRVSWIIMGLVFASAVLPTQKVKTLYNSLDPTSVSQQLAFYSLYSNYPEGKQALRDAWRLLSGGHDNGSQASLRYIPADGVVEGIVNLSTRQSMDSLPALAEAELATIEKLGNSLPNRRLKGYQARTESDVLALPSEEIDLGRALLLTQLEEPDFQKIRTYEAMLDLMALQIRARLSPQATPQEKIRTINDLIFGELGFKFPPHSLYAKEIDLYTFLPSVLDSRRGVCLGVSILYISLAQRLNLSLEMITPPGHIYVRWRQGEQEINIETTARGVHVNSEEYLSINTCALQERNTKQVVGLAHFNQAAVFSQQKKYDEAVRAYEKARQYLPEDNLLKELLAYHYLFIGREEEAKKILEEVRDFIPSYAITGENMAEDLLLGRVDAEGIKAVFLHVDETRESVLKKKDLIKAVVSKYPQFRDGIFQLAVSWLQLHREGEALEVLEQYHHLEPNDPTAEYYMAALYLERFDYTSAWGHLKQAEKILLQSGYAPKALKQLRKELHMKSPD